MERLQRECGGLYQEMASYSEFNPEEVTCILIMPLVQPHPRHGVSVDGRRV